LKAVFKYSLLVLLLHALVAHAAITVTNIAQGGVAYHSLFLKSDASLWTMGINDRGQLGDGTSDNARTPEEIVNSNVTAIAVGRWHTLFLKSDGSLWAMGDNSWGQLGAGTLGGANRPIEIVTNNVTAIAAGYHHSLFLKSDGSLWAMGGNNSGQLGDGTTDSGQYQTNEPEEIISSGVIAIAAGQDHSLFVKSDGSLWGMGGAFIDTNQPEEIVTNGVTAIAAGGGFSLFLKSDGSLWAMGDNNYGELGDGTFNNTNQPQEIVASNVTAVTAGEYHSLFLKSDGSLWTMGENDRGQLGDGTFNSTNQPEKIVTSNVTAIVAGLEHSLFLKSDGSLWAMGFNGYGQLGDGFGDQNHVDWGIPIPEQICPPPPPVLMETILSNTNLHFTATCLFGGKFNLLANTNLDQPLNQWMPIWTNSVITRGADNFSATLTNVVGSGSQQFFILQSQ
jgi:alpha-tubulin suppressor-like RCC1 family protein